MATKGVRRIGIVGYGHLGQYLHKRLEEHSEFVVDFVWNRSTGPLADLNPTFVLDSLDNVTSRSVDIIVEVAHPCVIQKYGEHFLRHADLLIGSPTALADADTERRLRHVATTGPHGLYLPVGAFWGGEDIKKMADLGTLQDLKITMTKHPSCFKLVGELKDKLDAVTQEDGLVELYNGPVRQLCRFAPNNVNTMAVAAMAAHNLGFDRVTGCLKTNCSLTDFHIVEVDCWGPENSETGNAFFVSTKRSNPSNLGVVTGTATYGSFLCSVLAAKNKGEGVHLC